MVLTHFWPSRPQFWSLIILHEACRCLVVCKRGISGLSRFWGIWGERSPNKKRVRSGPKDASSAYLFFIRVSVWVRVRVTKLVYQIGFTTFFRPQGRENILAASRKQQQAASSSSCKQAATEHISAYPHISVSIDGTSPKLAW